MRILFLIISVLIVANGFAQILSDTIPNLVKKDSLKHHSLNEIVITASRISETILKSPVSVDNLKATEMKNMGAATCFDAIENMKGVQIITPSLAYKVINTRGFANTTNVRFTQLIDGVDNQAPHIGAPIANALGANDLDIEKIEIIPGTASALYGMNAINGLVNIKTKSPFEYQGLSAQQLSGINHIGQIDNYTSQFFGQSNLRFAKIFNSKIAFKVNFSGIIGQDWVADNRTDLGASLNTTTGLTGDDNPAYDEVNGYGNESSNRKTLTLNGKKYVVARTGYREVDITDYTIKNTKGDVGLFYRLKKGNEVSVSYKGSLINNVYQRSNRFCLQDYKLNQYTLDYHNPIFEIRSYLTQENTGKSYNMRSLAENMDRAFKSDNTWFNDYTNGYNNAISDGATIADAHKLARKTADNGRFEPGTDAFNQKKKELININNWDYGAALRVKSYLSHSEGLINWDKLFPEIFRKLNMQLLSGFDHRTYSIIPDGNYFINPNEVTKNLLYSKSGGFTQLNQDLFRKKVRLSATVRADKADYFNWKFNPRFTVVYSPKESLNFRTAYQSGYRFPGIFEGFSNVNSGGVKRIGGLKIMSQGVFENSYTKASIDAFQTQVNSDVNLLGLTQTQAIEKNKELLKKSPYTYLQPEYVRSFEFGVRVLALKKRLFLDLDFNYNSYNNFIAQVEATIPKTSNPDSIPTYLYTKTKQDRYRLWTNSQSKIYNSGASLGIKYKSNKHLSCLGNITYSQLDRTDSKDGLEDGYNTPKWMMNGTIIVEDFWRNMGASITARYQTKYDYVSFLVSGSVPSYWAIDAQANYNFKRSGIVAKLGASNLLNKPYYTMLGGSDIGGFYYFSLTYTLNTNQKK